MEPSDKDGAPIEETPKALDAGSPDDSDAREEEVVLYLHADATITNSTKQGDTLSPEELTRTLTEAVGRLRAKKSTEKTSEVATDLPGKKRGDKSDEPLIIVEGPDDLEEIEEFEEEAFGEIDVATERDWVPAGPTVKIVAEPGATHAALDGLLKTCVDCGCEKFVLQNSNGGPPYAFVLRRSVLKKVLPDPYQLPPIRLKVTADENGRIDGIRFNQRHCGNFGRLRSYIVEILGDERGPRSVQEEAELEMECDADLQLQCVFDAIEAVTGYDTDSGDRVALLENVRPVPWGGALGYEEFEEAELEAIGIDTDPDVPGGLTVEPEREAVEEEAMETEANDPDAAAMTVELDPQIAERAPEGTPRASLSRYYGPGFSCRDAAVRRKMVEQGGGNVASEAAVAAALKWLAAHQFPDGSWDFDHARCPLCQGRCPNVGDLREAPRAATAMALLPFLGAGQTHMEGRYKVAVKNGLNYLVRNMKVRGGTGSFEEPGGRMYSHGLGSIALCEAYAMTRDKGLLKPAQLSLNHISYAQDPVGGGWRYTPKQAGDTSVFSWQLMALKSGHLAYLEVKPNTVKGGIKFLDSVQAANGSQYGYTDPATGRDATTAIGLLCRMYLGWRKDHPALQEGVKFISDKGPSKYNMYFNYYATQVMRHYEGDLWQKWNETMRDHLVNSQATRDHTKGSWHFSADAHGSGKGGRVYCTSLATMILEVYYRHMPIYQKQVAQDDFPL